MTGEYIPQYPLVCIPEVQGMIKSVQNAINAADRLVLLALGLSTGFLDAAGFPRWDTSGNPLPIRRDLEIAMRMPLSEAVPNRSETVRAAWLCRRALRAAEVAARSADPLIESPSIPPHLRTVRIILHELGGLKFRTSALRNLHTPSQKKTHRQYFEGTMESSHRLGDVLHELTLSHAVVVKPAGWTPTQLVEASGISMTKLTALAAQAGFPPFRRGVRSEYERDQVRAIGALASECPTASVREGGRALLELVDRLRVI